jgi:hypothetical protein
MLIGRASAENVKNGSRSVGSVDSTIDFGAHLSTSSSSLTNRHSSSNTNSNGDNGSSSYNNHNNSYNYSSYGNGNGMVSRGTSTLSASIAARDDDEDDDDDRDPSPDYGNYGYGESSYGSSPSLDSAAWPLGHRVHHWHTTPSLSSTLVAALDSTNTNNSLSPHTGTLPPVKRSSTMAMSSSSSSSQSIGGGGGGSGNSQWTRNAIDQFNLSPSLTAANSSASSSPNTTSRSGSVGSGVVASNSSQSRGAQATARVRKQIQKKAIAANVLRELHSELKQALEMWDHERILSISTRMLPLFTKHQSNERADVLEKRGHCHLKLSHYSEAFSDLTEALSLAQRESTTWYSCQSGLYSIPNEVDGGPSRKKLREKLKERVI